MHNEVSMWNDKLWPNALKSSIVASCDVDILVGGEQMKVAAPIFIMMTCDFRCRSESFLLEKKAPDASSICATGELY